ncbi:unnamed protein product [Clonostachys solani]|uniref:Zn(2)-C6 fungal-type domain-containing protein n=1 Tax=Clonostachys solani TaxID=160281 RepID=A0A9N9Z9Z4_9HYPO|nr:unnamed protein product [Clonostachys solani]
MESTGITESRDLPSCAGCRARKLKCSREIPSCTNCQRLDLSCIYDSLKNKPGLKRGTVEKLTKRIDSLERQILDRDDPLPNETLEQTTAKAVAVERSDSDTSAFTALTLETKILSSTISELSRTISVLTEASRAKTSSPAEPETRSAKRQKVDDSSAIVPGGSATRALTITLGSQEDVESLLETYFANLHPWIPMIHGSLFRNNVTDKDGELDNELVLHAILIGASRYNDQRKTPVDISIESFQTSCDHILLTANQSLRVKNLQALIILAFKYLGDGDLTRAWPIVAALTRMAEFLGICVEQSEVGAHAESFFTPHPQALPQNWAEEEEIRRVFWNIFILDRICSITTGWKVALTADNSSRRLPVCGTFWNENAPRVTPYFSIWDKSATKISNSVAFLPAHSVSPKQPTDPSNDGEDVSPGEASHSTPYLNTSNTGAFAYFVESLESLYQVNEYFLRQRVNFDNRQEVFSWLTRFKELDFRLVQWKTLLPPKWKDPNVPPPETANILDPNMSLAHVTHNTSMIMLHQKIGYPDSKLKGIPLPNFYSAETCHSAAVETSNITRNYLRHSSTCRPLSPHWAFCVFASAKILLVHHRHYSQDLSPHFWSLVQCLQEMTQRWIGNSRVEPTSSLPGQLLGKLQSLHADPTSTSAFISRIYDDSLHSPHVSDSHEAEHLSPRSRLFVTRQSKPGQFASLVEPLVNLSGHISEQPGVERPGPDWLSPSQVPDCRMSTASGGTDELSSIIKSFSGEQFTGMDRIINFDDLNFEGICDIDPVGQGITQPVWNFGSDQWPGPEM